MGKLSKQVVLQVGIASLSAAIVNSIPASAGMYDMRPKNHFRGGSVGKGGKIKYRRS